MRTVALPLPRSFDASLVQRLRTYAPYALAALFFLVYFVSYPRTLGQAPLLNASREHIGYLLAGEAAKGNGFEYDIAHYDELPLDVARSLTPRDAAIVDDHVAPQDFAGTMLLYAGAFAVSPDAAPFVSPLFGVLSAAMAARIGREFLQLPFLITFAFVLTLPVLWLNASFVVMSDVITLFFVLASTYFFLHYWRQARRSDLLLASFAMSLAILFRYPNIILAVVPAVALIVGKRFRLQDVVLAGLVGLPAGLVILAFNAAVYGSPLTSGFHLSSELVTETVNFKQESFLLLQPNVFWSYLRSYFLQVDYRLALATTMSFAAGVAVAALVAWRYRKTHRLLGLWAVALFVILFGYYGGRQGWGIGGPYVNSSLFRYMLPAFVFSGLFLLYGVLNLGNRPNARAWPAFVRDSWRLSDRKQFLGLGQAGAALVLAGVMLANVGFTYFGSGGISDSRRSVGKLDEVRAQVLNNTEKNAIVATNLYDKIIFPNRQTLTLSFAVNNELPIDRGNLLYSDVGPTPEGFAEVARTIFDADIPFYVIPRAARGNLIEYGLYEQALQLVGLHMEPVAAVTAERMYRIDQATPPPWSPEQIERQNERLPDRFSCREITGTPFRSGLEREFYFTNCIGGSAPSYPPEVFQETPLLP